MMIFWNHLQVEMRHIVVVQVLDAKQDLLDEEARLETFCSKK